MLQEILALIVIFFFLARLGWQLWHEQIPRGQFFFWLTFWLIAGVLIIFIRQIDALAARLGFSSSGIELLLYIAVAVIFYYLFRLRLKLERMDQHITQLAREISWHTAKKPNKEQ